VRDVPDRPSLERDHSWFCQAAIRDRSKLHVWFVSAIVPALISLTVIPLMIYRLLPAEIRKRRMR
jgi:hypothetical protein